MKVSPVLAKIRSSADWEKKEISPETLEPIHKPHDMAMDITSHMPVWSVLLDGRLVLSGEITEDHEGAKRRRNMIEKAPATGSDGLVGSELPRLGDDDIGLRVESSVGRSASGTSPCPFPMPPVTHCIYGLLGKLPIHPSGSRIQALSLALKSAATRIPFPCLYCLRHSSRLTGMFSNQARTMTEAIITI